MIITVGLVGGPDIDCHSKYITMVSHGHVPLCQHRDPRTDTLTPTLTLRPTDPLTPR